MIQNDHPIKNSYWVKTGCFLAGEYPRDHDEESSKLKVSALIETEVSLFIDLTEDRDGLKSYAYLVHQIENKFVKISHCPIRDLSVPLSIDYTKNILDIIDAEIEIGGIVFVHCWGGIGRTGTIVGCWLSRHGFKGEAALKKLKDLWSKCPKSLYRESPETDEQRDYVLNWDEG